jgi:predicted TIM-barrel fold metal-dependent hydrolase
MRNGFRVIDADGHFYEPGDIWDKYVEPKYYERRPRVVKVHGKAILEYEGEEPMSALRSKQLFSQMDAKFGHAFSDNWSLESRLKDMDTEGWDIQVCLPTNAAAAPAHKDADMAAALCRAYNNWAHDFAGASGNRVKFTAVTPGKDPADMEAECRRAVGELGAVSIFLPTAIPDKMWHHRDYNRVWATVQDLDAPVSIHGVSSASGIPLAAARYEMMDGAFIALSEAIGFPFENMINLGHFMYSGILDRYPKLRLLILEANSGWVPFWLNRLEKYCEGRQSVFFDEHPLKATPQEYFKRQCAVAADADEPSIKYVVDYLGDDNIVFNTDYPHPDAPATSEPLKNMMEQPLSKESKKKILWDNSVKIYGQRLVADSPMAKGQR